MEKIATNFGSVEVDELVRVYNIYKRRAGHLQKKRREYLQTDEGRDKNRERAKNYYHEHREAILEKRKEEYQKKKDNQ